VGFIGGLRHGFRFWKNFSGIEMGNRSLTFFCSKDEENYDRLKRRRESNVLSVDVNTVE